MSSLCKQSPRLDEAHFKTRLLPGKPAPDPLPGPLLATASPARPAGAGETPAPADSAPPTKKHRGVPKIFDEYARNQYCELLRRGLAKGDAARLLGVTRATVSNARRDPEFDLRVRQAVLDCHSRAAAQIVRAGDTHWRAAAWVLATEPRKLPPVRPRDLRPLLFDKRCREELKHVIREVLGELLSNHSDGRPNAGEAAASTPLAPTMIQNSDDTAEFDRIMAKIAAQINAVGLGRARQRELPDEETQKTTRHVKELPETPPAGAAQDVSSLADAATICSASGRII